MKPWAAKWPVERFRLPTISHNPVIFLDIFWRQPVVNFKKCLELP